MAGVSTEDDASTTEQAPSPRVRVSARVNATVSAIGAVADAKAGEIADAIVAETVGAIAPVTART